MSLIVMIVDDDKAVRFFHQVIVSQSGLSNDPLSFCNGREAFDYLDQNSDQNCTYLVLLDINMPLMDGWALMDAISDKIYRKQVHIVIVTSFVSISDREKAKINNMVIDVIEKPISHEDCNKIMNSFYLTSCFSIQ